MKIYLPVFPKVVNQAFGSNPIYYLRFGDKGHSGIDLAASHGQPVYAPCDGDAFYVQDAHGGDGIYIRTPNNGEPQANIILWHLCSKDDPKYKPLIPTDGSVVPVKIGQLIGYADNTGAPFESSGDHLHLGYMPCDKTGAPLNPNNGFHGCEDPAPFMQDFFAKDVPATQAVVSSATEIVTVVAEAPITPQEKSSLLDSLKQVLIKVAGFIGFKD